MTVAQAILSALAGRIACITHFPESNATGGSIIIGGGKI